MKFSCEVQDIFALSCFHVLFQQQIMSFIILQLYRSSNIRDKNEKKLAKQYFASFELHSLFYDNICRQKMYMRFISVNFLLYVHIYFYQYAYDIILYVYVYLHVYIYIYQNILNQIREDVIQIKEKARKKLYCRKFVLKSKQLPPNIR